MLNDSPFRTRVVVLPFLTGLALLLADWNATAQSPDKPKRSEWIFDVTGLECGACVYQVQQAIKDTKGVAEVEVFQTQDGYAKVAFDPKVVSEHQLAQAVRGAFALHGSPYLLRLRLTIPAGTTKETAAKVEAVFATWKPWVDVKPFDQAKGEFVLQFKPLAADAKQQGPQGWDISKLESALKAPAPDGLGLAIRVGQPEMNVP